MTLESDLEELEVMLGHQPITQVKHPNPERSYPHPFSDWWKKMKMKIKNIFYNQKKDDILE